ncbi:MAG: beta-galactosidase [Candidatus Paceibacterota bacterium]|jgi:hypothetical protein
MISKKHIFGLIFVIAIIYATTFFVLHRGAAESPRDQSNIVAAGGSDVLRVGRPLSDYRSSSTPSNIPVTGTSSGKMRPTPSPKPVLTPTPAPTVAPSGSASTVMKASPKGYFLLPDKTSSVSTLEALIKKVDGIVIITTWKDIEPQEGTYDFSSIDQKLAIAQAAGKEATLDIFTGKNSLPSWISAAGVQTWTDAKGSQLVYPTDPTFVKLWGERVAMLGARYDGNPTIRQISMCGSTGTLCGPRYPELPSGVSFEALESVWSQVIASYVSAFPSTLKQLEVHLTAGHDTDLPSYLLKQTGEGVGIFAEFLSDTSPAESSPVPEVIRSFPTKWCGFQMVSPLRDRLAAAIAHGSSLGCNYFEIYQGDVSNGYLPPAK